MKEKFNYVFFRNYVFLVIALMMVEIIFRVVSDLDVFTIALVRIFLFINIFSVIVSFALNYVPKLARKIINSVIVFGFGAYACAQIGFLNFLGVYISLQTSSQLGAVVDYIIDFMKSFKVSYFATLIPFVIGVVYYIFMEKKTKKATLKKAGITTLIVLAVAIPLFAVSIVFKGFQDKYQTISNAQLFQTASNPAVTIEQYGTTGFLFLDVKAIIHPVEIEETFVSHTNKKKKDEPITDDTRVIDDTAWKEVMEETSNKTYKSLNDYFYNRDITDKNDYTGMFEGKNLVVIMMESANDILINPDLYPNFYKMLSGGWYWENNFSPRNSCATMNNEFSGMTSLYSIINTCTANTYKRNHYDESIFNLFNEKNYTTFSAHDYNDSYYYRSTIHPNMGSGEYFSARKLGVKYYNEYKNWASDEDFLKAMLGVIDKKTTDGKPFMTWLTTVSGHQPYYQSSIEGDKYLDITKGTKYTMDIRRYMSKLKTLDNALGLFMEGLEQRGILQDTVFILYGDHYPYGIKKSHINQVLDYDTNKDLDAERVPFVIYNSQMTPQVHFEYTTYMNILPTVANLFNLNYDPRFYLGTDLFSEDYKSLTVFADGSWKNEIAFYNSSTRKIKYYGEQKYTDEEIKEINEDINTKISVSSSAIKSDYFNYVIKAINKKRQEIKDRNGNTQEEQQPDQTEVTDQENVTTDPKVEEDNQQNGQVVENENNQNDQVNQNNEEITN